jgi:hypothetical protein
MMSNAMPSDQVREIALVFIRCQIRTGSATNVHGDRVTSPYMPWFTNDHANCFMYI